MSLRSGLTTLYLRVVLASHGTVLARHGTSTINVSVSQCLYVPMSMSLAYSVGYVSMSLCRYIKQGLVSSLSSSNFIPY